MRWAEGAARRVEMKENIEGKKTKQKHFQCLPLCGRIQLRSLLGLFIESCSGQLMAAQLRAQDADTRVRRVAQEATFATGCTAGWTTGVSVQGRSSLFLLCVLGHSFKHSSLGLDVVTTWQGEGPLIP